MRLRTIFLMLAAAVLAAQQPVQRPDGLYAEIRTSRGLVVARLEPDLVPMTVANFVGLAEGAIANSAFDPGRPFYDGSVWHRVVPGHVIQAGIPASDRSRTPGYTFPNEIHARLSHNRAGVLNMANGGPNTNAAQFCITLGNRSYLDGDFNVFGEVVEGLDVVMRIAQGDLVQSVRILRVGARAQAFHPTTESFRAMVKEAEQRVVEQQEKKKIAEQEWIERKYPASARLANGLVMQVLDKGDPPAESGGPGVKRVLYAGREIRYVGDVIGRDGPPLEEIPFTSGENGVPGFPSGTEPPSEFVFEPGKTKINPGLDSAIAAMGPGERRIVIVPASLGYGRAGLYPPEVPGKRRFVVSPNAMLMYEVAVQ